MGLLDFLTVFDWISPTIGLAQDSAHAITGKHGTMTIQVSVGDLAKAAKILGKEVVSTGHAAGDSEADITIECYGGDGYDSVRKAMQKLQDKGVDVTVYPPWV